MFAKLFLVPSFYPSLWAPFLYQCPRKTAISSQTNQTSCRVDDSDIDDEPVIVSQAAITYRRNKTEQRLYVHHFPDAS